MGINTIFKKKTMKFYSKIILLFLFLISLNACKAKQIIGQEKPIIIGDNPYEETIEKPVVTLVKDSIIKGKEIKKDSISSVLATITKKDIYTIAIILPLFTDSLTRTYSYQANTDLSKFKIPELANESLQFLEGAFLALEQLNLKTKFTIKIYDDLNAEERIAEILKDLDENPADFIIGPPKKQNLSLVANYAKNKNIVCINAFSPSKSIINQYEKMIMLTPSIESHFKAMAEFVKKNHPDANVRAIYTLNDNSSSQAKLLEKIFTEINEQPLNGKKIDFAAVVNEKGTFKLYDQVQSGKKNILIILSFNEGYIYSMVNSLLGINRNNDLIVFGMPNWKDIETIRVEYLNRIQLHYTDNVWLDPENEKNITFIEAFSTKNKIIPFEKAYLGYDLFSFLPIYIEKYGLNLAENIHLESFEGLINSYQFQPEIIKSEGKADQIKLIENQKVHIISYQDFKLMLQP